MSPQRVEVPKLMKCATDDQGRPKPLTHEAGFVGDLGRRSNINSSRLLATVFLENSWMTPVLEATGIV